MDKYRVSRLRTGLTAIVAMLMLCTGTVSAAKEYVISYLPSQMPATVNPVGFEGEGSVRLSAAIRLPRAMMLRYGGSRITRIRVGVRQGFSDMSVWIRTQLDSSSRVVQSLQQPADGWNEVTLRTPYTITDGDLYIGYTATQPEGFKGVLAAGQGTDCTSWLAQDNQWADYHEQGLGILFIEAVVEGQLCTDDAALMQIGTDRQCYAEGETATVTGTVANTGTSDIAGWRVALSIDGEPTMSTLSSDKAVAQGQTADFEASLPLSGLTEGAHQLTAVVTPRFATDGQTDEKKDNDTLRTTLFVYHDSYRRTMLLEHFTSLPCVNCPPIDRMLEQAVEGRTDVAWVSHHVGYKDDEFTIGYSQPLVRYGVNGNPYIMLDRTTMTGSHPAFTIGGYTLQFLKESVLGYASGLPAFVTLQATATADGDDLSVTVNGLGKAFAPQLYPRATLHIYVVEDSVEAVGVQAGDASKRLHDNILRMAATPVRGTAVAWSTGDESEVTFEHQTTVTLDPSWRRDHLRVVAFLTAQAPTGTGWPTGEVLNTVQTPVGATASVHVAEMGGKTACQWFTIDGRRLDHRPTHRGIYIKDDKKTYIK